MARALQGTGWTDIGKAAVVFRKRYAEPDGSFRFLSQLRENDQVFSSQNQAICSNKPEDFVRKIPERLDCLHPFKFIGGGAFKTRKPDPEDIDHLLARRDPSLHQCADGEQTAHWISKSEKTPT